MDESIADVEKGPIPLLYDLGIRLKELLLSWSFSEELAKWTHLLMFILVMVLVIWVVNKLTKTVIVSMIKRFIRKTKTSFDDILLEKGVFGRLAHLAPALVVYALLPTMFTDFPSWINFFRDLTNIYMVYVGITVLNAMLNSLNTIYMKRDNAQNAPIKGYIQVVQIILIIIAAVWALSILFNFELKGFFTGLGPLPLCSC